jgi:hypothetical protein
MRHLIILLFILFAALQILLQKNGPFIDEGIYITAGIRTFEGNGLSDRYLTWFHGYLVWPLISAAGFKLAGIMGTRMFALLFAAVSLTAVSVATKNLYNEKVAVFTTLALAVFGPFLFLSGLGVYDLPAIAGLSLSFWAITKLKINDNRLWLFFASMFYSLGAISKYPSGVMILPLLLILFRIRNKKATIDILLFLFISAAFFLAFLYPVRDMLSELARWSVNNKPSFGATRLSIFTEILYLSSVPTILALLGWLYTRKTKLGIEGILLISGIIWPIYHLSSGDPVSMNKHLVFGFLFYSPLIGVFLYTLWKKTRLASVVLVLALIYIGIAQSNYMAKTWLDTRDQTAFLIDNSTYGQKYLINNSWPFTAYLYSKNKIDTPWDIYDVYRATNLETENDLCDFDWYIDEKRPPEWPDEIRNKITSCGTFQLVYTASNKLTNMGSDGKIISFTVTTDIWKNTKGLSLK